MPGSPWSYSDGHLGLHEHFADGVYHDVTPDRQRLATRLPHAPVDGGAGVQVFVNALAKAARTHGRAGRQREPEDALCSSAIWTKVPDFVVPTVLYGYGGPPTY